MKKYIVKNCPAYNKQIKSEEYAFPGHVKCDCGYSSGCIMKKIVELCKNKDYFVKKFPYAQFSSAVQNSELAFDILQLLNIEECE